MNVLEKQDNTDSAPLILDVDGSLLRTNMLLETFWSAMGKNPFATLWVVVTTIRHPARLKHALRLIREPAVGLLPVDKSVLEFAREQQKSGRRVILTSGANQFLVDSLARTLDFQGAHYGSTKNHNLTGANKAALLIAKFGEGGFDYVGNAAPDLKVWQVARKVIAVAPNRLLAAQISTLGKPVQTIGQGWNFSSIIKEMRPNHWIKNILLFFPLLAMHSSSLESYFSVLMTFFAFCVGTSAVYIGNDILDLEADRQHPKKKNRPIASGALPISVGMAASYSLGAFSLFLGWLESWEVVGFLCVYFAATLAYSLRLKRYKWLDLVILALLYTLRVLTGAATTNTALSGWLVGFVFSSFVALAVVKRLTELKRTPNNGRMLGRGYVYGDFKLLGNIAVLCISTAVLMFLAYSVSPVAATLYSHPVLLQLVVIPNVFWMLRMVQLSQLGQGDYDPVYFVEHDKTGLTIIAAGLALAIFAI